MTTVQALLALHEPGWSQRDSPREFDIDRETVARYLAQARAAKPAILLTGSGTRTFQNQPFRCKWLPAPKRRSISAGLRAWVGADGTRRCTHVLRIVLSHRSVLP
jgi:hypothetical protein